MAYIYDLGVAAEALHTLLETNKDMLGLKGVYLGETRLKPDYPAVEIQAVNLKRTVSGTHKFRIDLTVDIILHVFKMGDPEGRESNILALVNTIRQFIHQDKTLGGQVIIGIVTEENLVDIVGESTNTLTRGASLTWEALSQETF